MEFFWQWVMLVSVFGVALASPGPDFIMAVRNSILYSRAVGIMTALGFAAGVLVHVGYTIIGLAAIIAQSIVAFTIIKYAGAAYLVYMGIKAIRSKGFTPPTENGQAGNTPNNAKSMGWFDAFASGFLTNVLNPKAAIFFLSIFAQFTGVDTSWTEKLVMAGTCVAMTAIWFSVVAVILTNPTVKERFLKAAQWIDRICGVLFIALGLRIALTKAPVMP